MDLLWFTFAGAHSLLDHGVRILSRPVIPSPGRRFQTIHIPGRSSNIWYDDGTLDDLQIQVSCGLTLPSGSAGTSLMDRFQTIEDWLYSVPEGPLVFNFHPGREYQARVNGPLELEVRMRRLGRFAIPFLCRPPSGGE